MRARQIPNDGIREWEEAGLSDINLADYCGLLGSSKTFQNACRKPEAFRSG
jgi:hypothetical protein